MNEDLIIDDILAKEALENEKKGEFVPIEKILEKLGINLCLRHPEHSRRILY